MRGIRFFLLASSLLVAKDIFAKSSTELFKQLSPIIFRIETSGQGASEKESYGTGFVIDKTGLLLTNYHVVSDSVLATNDRKLEVLVDGKRIGAQVLSIDAVSDLALVQIPHEFTEAASISSRVLDHGETVFSLGFPVDLNASIVQGNFNGRRSLGPYENYQTSAPINPGMSGGPTVDESGTVIGVNVSILQGAQNISFLVPAAKVEKFLKESEARKRSLSRAWALKEIHKQLKMVQTSLYEAWKKNDHATEAMDNWKFRKPMEGLKCWSDDSDERGASFSQRYQSCFSEFSSVLWPRFQVGFMQSEFISRSAPEMALYPFYEIMQSELEKDKPPLWPVVKLSERWKSFYSKFHCQTSSMTNIKGIPLSVAYCSRAYGPFEDLFDIVVRVATRIPESRLLSAEFVFSGFEVPTVEKIVEGEVNSIEN